MDIGLILTIVISSCIIGVLVLILIIMWIVRKNRSEAKKLIDSALGQREQKEYDVQATPTSPKKDVSAVRAKSKPDTKQKLVCQGCGAVNLAIAKFCDSCGAELTIQEKSKVQERPKVQEYIQTLNHCQNCSKANPLNAKFCAFCGAELSKAESLSKKEDMCPSCGKANPPGSKFCAFCGSNLEQVPKAPEDLLCPSCNIENKPDSTFCFHCGAKLG